MSRNLKIIATDEYKRVVAHHRPVGEFIHRNEIVTVQSLRAGESTTITVNCPNYQQAGLYTLNDLILKYKIKNLDTSDSFKYNIYGIWSLLSSIRVKLNGTYIINLDNQTDIKNKYISYINRYQTIKEYLNSRIGTINSSTIGNLDSATTLSALATSSYFISSFSEIFDIFTDRSYAYIKELQIELQVVPNSSDIENARAIVITDPALVNMSALEINSLSCISITSVHNAVENVPNTIKLYYPHMQNKTFPLVANTLNVVKININNSFSPVSSMEKIYFYVRSTVCSTSAGTQPAEINSEFRTSMFTKLVYYLNGVIRYSLDGSEVYLKYIKARQRAEGGRGVIDNDYTSSDMNQHALSWYLPLSNDQFTHETDVNQLSGITNNNSSGTHEIELNVDLSGQNNVKLNELVCILESSRLINIPCFSCGKSPTIST